MEAEAGTTLNDLALLAVALLAYALVGRQLARIWISAAMFFTALGLLAGPSVLSVFQLKVGGSPAEMLVSVTLATVLFGDAMQVRLSQLRRHASGPARLLSIGLLGTVLLGGVAAQLVFGCGWAVAFLVAVILAPTDAALGSAVVVNKAVPARVRDTLFVESGLNDGIAVPLFVIALAWADIQELGDAGILQVIFMKIVVSALLGTVLAVGSYTILRLARGVGAVEGAWASLVPLLTAFACYLLSEQAGGSGFIAAFVGGIAFGTVSRRRETEGMQVDEAVSSLLQGATWFLFGALMVGPVLFAGSLQVSWFVYAVLSLTVVRLIPVALALLGSGFDRPAVAFIAWFGPRGLASVVFLLIALEYEPADRDLLGGVVTVTVLLSVLVHGLSATPLAARFGAYEQARAAGVPART